MNICASANVTFTQEYIHELLTKMVHNFHLLLGSIMACGFHDQYECVSGVILFHVIRINILSFLTGMY